jgi:dTDP-4-amino-4,6-dideoxygalactose transaminase
MTKVPFGDLKRQYLSIQEEIDTAWRRVMQSGWFILGEEVASLESEFALYLGARNCVAVGSGTEAIHLALAALGADSGDQVITAANTCVPTASAISFAGCVPVLVDVDPLSYNLDPAKLERAITKRTRAIVPVHLYGQAADMDPILQVAREYAIPVIEDVAQGHGASYKGRKLGTLGLAGCFSFYPSKNMGAYGDGGAIVTGDGDFAGRLKSLRNYGEARRYRHSIKGFNSRLDEVQAAILRVKLAHLDVWNEIRAAIAVRYDAEISNPAIVKPVRCDYGVHNYHLYVVRCAHRDRLQSHLADRGIMTLIHYPVPIHLQEAYSDIGGKSGDFPIAEKCADEVLSLPIFPELTEDEVSRIIDAVNAF